ncbi:MAG: DciA family protein [Candidatus Parcubacteria bacterium]|nr:DciA family protein [Candidatus Parcubacteria bacterium]
MDHIKNLLSRRIRQSAIGRQVDQAMIIEFFAQLIKKKLGDNISRRLKPVYLKNKDIYIACVSSVIKQEIILRKAELLADVNEKFGPQTIMGIKFI